MEKRSSDDSRDESGSGRREDTDHSSPTTTPTENENTLVTVSSSSRSHSNTASTSSSIPAVPEKQNTLMTVSSSSRSHSNTASTSSSIPAVPEKQFHASDLYKAMAADWLKSHTRRKAGEAADDAWIRKLPAAERGIFDRALERAVRDRVCGLDTLMNEYKEEAERWEERAASFCAVLMDFVWKFGMRGVAGEHERLLHRPPSTAPKYARSVIEILSTACDLRLPSLAAVEDDVLQFVRELFRPVEERTSDSSQSTYSSDSGSEERSDGEGESRTGSKRHADNGNDHGPSKKRRDDAEASNN